MFINKLNNCLITMFFTKYKLNDTIVLKIGGVMEFHHLKSFIYVANESSFSKAADLIFISQPAVSAHISQLEKELDTKLFIRDTKGVILTQEGKKFYKYAVDIINTRDKSLKAMGISSEKLEGTLQISASSVPQGYILSEILKDFNKIHPDVKYKIKKYNSEKVIEKINDSLIDFGIVGTNKFEKKLKYIKLIDDEIILVSNRKNLEIDISEIEKYPLIMRNEGSATRSHVINEIKNTLSKDINLNIIVECEDNDTIKQLVKSGIGISFISKKVVSDLIDLNKLYEVKIDKFKINRNFYFVFNKDKIFSLLSKEFSNFLINRLRK